MNVTSDRVHTYHDNFYDAGSLRFLGRTFRASYEASIAKHGAKQFIKVYQGTSVIEKSFKDFDVDVKIATSYIAKNLNEETIFVSLATNSYLHAVYLIAAHLKGLTLCPINGEDELASIQKKLATLPSQPVIWHDCDNSALKSMQTPVKSHLMTLTASAPAPVSAAIEFPQDRPMVLIFTSGSTGYSKIVEQMQSNILTNVDALIEHHQLMTAQVIATSLPLFHVNALEFSFFSSLLSGSKFIMYSKFDLATVSASLRTDEVSILSLVPTLIRVLIQRSTDFMPGTGSKLKYIVSAAAPLSTDLARQFLDLFKIPLIQGFGLSEAVNFSALMPIGRSIEHYHKWLTEFPHPSVGIALRGNEVHVLNPEGKSCQPGEIGEICLRGWNVMRGYTDLIPEVLFADGFLHTGDLGYFHLEDDREPYFFISGRLKDVIKKNGHTVSLRELDDLIIPLLPQTGDAISVGFSNDYSGEETGVIATLTERQDQELFLKDLALLPKIMRPSVVLFRMTCLRTPSGKPQRWRFKAEFDKFENLFLGTKIRSET